MKTLVIASRNKKKRKEIKYILKGMDIEVLTLDDIDTNVPEIVEDGKTFKQNAIKKAVTVSTVIGGFVLADDSGLMVKALGGKPGVRSSRFAHAKANDEENIKKLMALMENVPDAKRQAAFVSTIAIADKGNLIGCAEGTCAGTIGFIPKGNNGFGYDPLFTPKGYKKTFAEMSPAYKNRISHRSKALEKAKGIIRKYISKA